MPVQIIKCWRLEAKGETSNTLITRFTSRAAADSCGELLQEQNKFVGYGPEVKKEVIELFDTAVEFDPTLDTRTKREALAKLTRKEKQALGLT